ncbi:2,3-bisphosphoglycerate-dependent phosphoglycerate mutase [Methylobacterium pseudosasicola]|uniref:2,3-bisphosphoglycerate-dependent phosphoglycerate mutase n=1 Tax=Methylobacterium pseudosasicola TaxID=582667 RepID=A0A1I4SGZ6_9HYPH|nr:2,3-bisphosphoglycerate-dependent phosphoglycerate mutase [Methylobacterium pseudosasicola]
MCGLARHPLRGRGSIRMPTSSEAMRPAQKCSALGDRVIHDRKAPITRRLVLVRHGQSVANRSGLFTGLLDSPLTEQGRIEAVAAGRRLAERSWRFSDAFTSTLTRAVVSGRLILDTLGQPGLIPQRFAALDERDYGDLSGLDRTAADARWGAERIETWRRSYAEAPPNGESLRDTLARIVPCYLRSILPAVMGGDVLVVAHGNCLRALAMALDDLSPAEVEHLELATGSVRIYEFAADTTIEAR